MSKKVVVVCGSPRKGGNAETLCDEFVRGCKEAGHEAEKILLRGKTIGFCQACYACRTNGTCIQQDDAAEVQRAMLEADVIVLATPVYFYSMSGQMKTLIDRCIACGAGLSNKSFYFIADHRRLARIHRLSARSIARRRDLWRRRLEDQ